MTFVIIIFLVSIILAFGMLFYRSWEIKNKKINSLNTAKLEIPKLPFRHLEKNMLYLTKHIVLGLVLTSAKYWFILSTKLKKWFNDKWPRINAYFKKKTEKVTSYRHSFVKKAILESKVKIRRIKEKVNEDMKPDEENTQP